MIGLDLGGTELAAGKPAMISSVFGLALAFIGTPILCFYGSRAKPEPDAGV